jgi:hypothetical protein
LTLRCSYLVARSFNTSRGFWSFSSISLKHVGQNIFCVLQSLDPFLVWALHGGTQGIVGPLALLINVRNDLGLWAEHNFCLILEVYLDDLVRETEHDGVTGSHPLLYINYVSQFVRFFCRGQQAISH